MKTLHTALTILFVIAVILSLFNFVKIIGSQPMPNGGAAAMGHVLGTILAAALIPTIIWVVRYFIGKDLKK